MRFIVSACVSALMLLVAGPVFAQQGTGTQEQPGRLPTVDTEFAALAKTEEDAKANEQRAQQQAAAKREAYQKELDQLNRQRQADETAAAFAKWQRDQTKKVNQLDREATQAQAQAGMAHVRRTEATAGVERAIRANPNLQRPSPPAATPNATPFTAPPIPRVQLPDINGQEAFKQAKQAAGFVPRFDTGRMTSPPPVNLIPGPALPNDPRLPDLRSSRPAPPVQNRPIIENTPRNKPIIVAPGGVIITSTADIAGLKPADVASASFDGASGILKFALRSGKEVTCKLDADDFAVAVRTVFDQQVDPTLSMSYDAQKPGFLAVDYTGPMFKTRFGKLMYEIDVVLGSITFNREGDHRAPASAFVPSNLVFEAGITRIVGSRVFLIAETVSFVIDNDRLVCRQVESRVQVTATGYSADYFEEAMHRVARVMTENFDGLVEKFPEFKEFRRLAECVALAKWLKRHSIAFDWAALKTRTLAEHEFPAYVPGASWVRLFNGRSLDGWRFNLPSGQFDSALKDSHLTLKPTGQQSLEILKPMWAKAYDLRYVVETEGPVEFILRDGSGTGAASLAIDTKGQRHALELFLRDGKWSVIGPGVDKAGDVTIPELRKGERPQPTNFGMRVPPGSKLVLYAAALRQW